MTAPNVTSVFAVKDAKIRRITADATGAAITVAASVDVPGIKSVAISGDISLAELRGDNARLDVRSVLQGISVEFEYAKLSLPALEVMLGGTTTTAGTTPNVTSTFAITGAETFNYFQFEAASVGSDAIGGDVVFRLNKCILSEFPDLGLEEEDYQTFTVSAEAMKPLGTNPWLEIVSRQTGALLT